jgi:maleate isomerase
MWERDGWDAKWRIGVLVPYADVGPESEMQAMAPPDLVVHATRVPFGAMRAGGGMDPTIPLAPVRAFAEPPDVDDATELLAGAPIHAIAFGFTSSAYVLGTDGERAMLDRLATRSRGLPVVATCASIVAALRALGVRRVALYDPPWFDEELNSLGAAYYRSAGFHVAASSTCDLASDQSRIEPAEVFGFVRSRVRRGHQFDHPVWKPVRNPDRGVKPGGHQVRIRNACAVISSATRAVCHSMRCSERATELRPCASSPVRAGGP